MLPLLGGHVLDYVPLLEFPFQLGFAGELLEFFSGGESSTGKC